MRIPYQVARQIANHAAAEAPNEACGLIAGDSRTISRAIPLRNSAANVDARFQVDAAEQLAALKALDAEGLDWLGVYHSHPRSAPIPSQADIDESNDPKLLHLIVSLERAKPQLKLWRIDGLAVRPVDLVFDTEAVDQDDSTISTPQRVAIVVAAIASLLLLVTISIALLPPAPEVTLVP